MEGAGESIVNHAAERRGMDSADEEPELPSAVQDLIRRLEGEGEPITGLPDLSEEEFWDFFPEIASLSTITGWRRQVRLRVLEAIGSCNTFESLKVDDICGRDISRFTESEWEVVFRGFKSSTVLGSICLQNLKWSSDAEVESLCSQIGRILNSSSVQELEIFNTNLSARCWLHLASGLRGNSDSKLQSLKLVSNAVKHVADIINSATRLETLSLAGTEDVEDVEEEDVGILSKALIQSSSLKELYLEQVDWGAALLLNALARDDGNRSIERLWLSNMDRLGSCFRELLTSNRSLKGVTLNYLRMSPEEWRQLGEVIRDNATATTINVSLWLDQDDTYKHESIEGLAYAASSEAKDPTLELSQEFSHESELMFSLNLLGRVLRGEIKSLKSFRIWDFRTQPYQDRTEGILSMNGQTGETSVLKRLELVIGSKDVWKRVWKDLLLCLRGNTSLTHLDLHLRELDEEEFRDLMGLLQVNLTLQEIDVSGTPWATDGKEGLIQEALKQNQKRAVYMSIFREAKLTFGDAKAGRLFLCGSPRAGKTKLRQTLMRIVEGKSWLGNKWAELRRTKGIELEFLQNDEKRQISIWDLAGQWIFRTLQNVLFPQSSNFCVFLFVYSPFCQIRSLNKPESCFQSELEEWLSFITSSTRVTGHNLPQVLVVISHKDKGIYNSLNWAECIVKDLRKRFANFVDLHPVQELFHVNGQSKKQVLPLKKVISEIFDRLLSEKSPQVPQLCSQLSSSLVTKTKEIRSFPLWPSKKFHEFCAPSLTFISSSSAGAVEHSKIMTSIISYLNDVGSIISIPNLDYIIVDPNWLTNTLLGELVALGQDFQAHESVSSSKSISSESYTSKDGFVSESVFARLIKEFQRKQSHGERRVDRQVLEDILFNLDLCFKVEDTSQYFIPSFIPEHASTDEQNRQELAWETRVETSQFVGIRIQCQDGRTMSLTDAFFPRFQMFMRRKLISEMHVSKKTLTCSRYYLRLFLDGHQIYLEQGTSRNYVDVLMLCSDHKSREVAIKYVMKHIVQELISFCASPKGCPGVALVLGVIQTHCVKMLIPIHLRGAILIEELKSNFIQDINDKLEDIALDRFHLMKEEDLFSHEHPWPSIEGHITEVIFEKARDLLWKGDVEAIVNEIRQKQMQQLESLQQGLMQQLESLQQGVIEVNNDLIHSYPENDNMVTNSNFPDMKDSNRPSSSCLSLVSTSVENREIRLVLESIDRVEKKVDGVDERLRSVQSDLQRWEMKMKQVLSLQQELQSKLSEFMSKVDRIIEYSQEFRQTGTPKRPYVTDDVNSLYKISASLHVGTIVRLHLMCESTTGVHTVKDQEGLKIRVDRYNKKWIRKTIEIFYKVLYYAAKAALGKTLGLGQAIPDFADLKSDILKLDDISRSDRSAILKGRESMELKEAWLRIQQTLAPINYSKIFKLYQVKYVRVELGGHAWVCEECMTKGFRTGILSRN